MSLRTKTLLIVGLALSTVLGAMFYASRAVTTNRFNELERQDAESAAWRAGAVIASMVDDLNSECRGLAAAIPPGAPLQSAEAEDVHSDLMGILSSRGVQQSGGGLPDAVVKSIVTSGLL